MRVGLPRPIQSGLPVPWNVAGPPGGPYRFGTLDHERMAATERGRCQVCGEYLPDEGVVYVVAHSDADEPLDAWVVDFGGLHERCARIALAHCPHLREALPNGPLGHDRAGPIRVVVAGVRLQLRWDHLDRAQRYDEALSLPLWDRKESGNPPEGGN